MALELTEHNEDGLITVTAHGEVDLNSSPQLRDAILDAVQTCSTGVQVNLHHVAYMDSSGVATLVEGLQATTKNKHSFSLISPSESVLKVLQLARLDSVFTIEGTA